MANETECAHEPCECQAQPGSEYCSEACETAAAQGSAACMCGHRGCEASARATTRRSSAR